MTVHEYAGGRLVATTRDGVRTMYHTEGIRDEPAVEEADAAIAEMITAQVLRDVRAERGRQRGKYGLAHDGALTPADWLCLIERRVDRADQSFGAEYRRRLIQIAALAVAAVEAFDRDPGKAGAQ